MNKLDTTQSRLFTCIVTFDGGTAPNPDFGVCTLATCKPTIRRVAQVNDIIVGLDSSSQNLGRVIYCMQVEVASPWREYIENIQKTFRLIERYRNIIKIEAIVFGQNIQTRTTLYHHGHSKILLVFVKIMD